MPKLTKTYDARLMLKLERELLERIQSTAGPGKVNDWLRQAAREKLERDQPRPITAWRIAGITGTN